MATWTILVTIEVPSTVGDSDPDDPRYQGYRPTREQAKAYVQDAVESWGGQKHPTDPFFQTKVVKVK